MQGPGIRRRTRRRGAAGSGSAARSGSRVRSGTWFSVDSAGWLRLRSRAPAGGGWWRPSRAGRGQPRGLCGSVGSPILARYRAMLSGFLMTAMSFMRPLADGTGERVHGERAREQFRPGAVSASPLLLAAHARGSGLRSGHDPRSPLARCREHARVPDGVVAGRRNALPRGGRGTRADPCPPRRSHRRRVSSGGCARGRLHGARACPARSAAAARIAAAPRGLTRPWRRRAWPRGA